MTGIDGKIQYNPESLWKGNKFEGSRIIDGFLNFQKESVFINSNVWHKNHGSIHGIVIFTASCGLKM